MEPLHVRLKELIAGYEAQCEGITKHTLDTPHGRTTLNTLTLVINDLKKLLSREGEGS